MLTTEFLRKYLIFAKRKYARAAQSAGGKGGSSVLTMEETAIKRIVDYYVSLRALPPTQRNFPVTPRCLETIIRLATAHCKVSVFSFVLAETVPGRNHLATARPGRRFLIIKYQPVIFAPACRCASAT